MKDWKNKLTSKTFWLSLAAAVVVALQCFGVRVDAPYVNEAVSALCTVFIVLGIMRDDRKIEISAEENGEPDNNDGEEDNVADQNDGENVGN